MGAIMVLLMQIVDEKSRNLGDDIASLLLTATVRDDDGNEVALTHEQVAYRLLELTIAGHETTAKLIANGVVALDWYPDQRAELVADPSLIPNAVEEMLRWDPPSHYQGRWVEQDVTLHGVTIPADSRVILITGAANHDERVFDRPRVLRHPPRDRAPRRLRVRHPPLRRRGAGPARDAHRVRGAPGSLPELRAPPAHRARVLQQRARPVEPAAGARSRRVVRAWRAVEHGAPRDVLRLEEIDAPDAGPGEVRIQVDAVTLNFNDIDGIHGRYRTVPVPAPYTPGMEVLGTVEAVGAGVDAALLGTRVAAIPSGAFGGYAEVAVAPATMTFPMPESIPLPDAAAILMPFHLAALSLYRRARLEAGETVLIHAAAGGVGSAALQLARAAGAHIIALAGSVEKARFCAQLGADVAVDTSATDFVAAALEATGGRGVDVAFDTVGGDITTRTYGCMAFGGRHVLAGFASGIEAEDEGGLVPRPDPVRELLAGRRVPRVRRRSRRGQAGGGVQLPLTRRRRGSARGDPRPRRTRRGAAARRPRRAVHRASRGAGRDGTAPDRRPDRGAGRRRRL